MLFVSTPVSRNLLSGICRLNFLGFVSYFEFRISDFCCTLVVMHILITAGPTREYIDSVRFITNGSSGQMGCAVAVAALEAGHRVTLLIGAGVLDGVLEALLKAPAGWTEADPTSGSEEPASAWDSRL